jgi:hypothetical protein
MVATIAYAIIAAFQLSAIKGQLGEMKIATKAATDSAGTSKEYMHVSERAYLAVKDGSLDWKGKQITFVTQNIGHIPTGKVTVLTHEALVAIPPNGVGSIGKDAIEHYWSLGVKSGIPPEVPITAGSTTLFKLDPVLVRKGTQVVIVAGIISYEDGFPDDVQQRTTFCYQTVVQVVSKKGGLMSCDPEPILKELGDLDRYDPRYKHPQ